MVSIYIALYLFLAGTGAGAFLIGAIVDMVLRFRPRAAGGWFARVSAVTDAGLILGPVLVAVSALFLFLDLGVPDRVFHLFLASTSSLLSMGAWAILVFCVMATLALVLGSLADGEGDGYEYELAPGKVVLRVCEFAVWWPWEWHCSWWCILASFSPCILRSPFFTQDGFPCFSWLQRWRAGSRRS